MKLRILAVFAVLVLLFGCAEYSYTQEFKEDGNSTLELRIDYTYTIEMYAEYEGKTYETKLQEFKNEKKNECEELVNANSGITCKVEKEIVEISIDLLSGEYYNFTKKNNIPDHVYILELNKILNLNLLDPVTGIDAFELNGNLSEENRVKLQAAKNLGIKLEYIIIMPGEIFDASSGEVEGKIEGNKATFNLIEVAENAEPIIVKSKKVDEIYLYLVYLAVVVIFVWVMYAVFGPTGKKKKE